MATLGNWVGFAAVALLCVACPKKNPGATTDNAPSASQAVAPAPSASIAPMGKMAHCPSTVDTAKTEVNDVEGGIELAVTSQNPLSVAEIRLRSKFLGDASKATATTVHHNGHGEGGGVYGRCPVVMRNTTVLATDVEAGTKITVKPETPAELDWLRRETRERLSELELPGSVGAGANKMANCPNAVDGATTQVKDAKDGFEMVVTAKADDATAEIRKRSKHLVEAAKLDPANNALQHTGGGTGGGGLGRCPVVMKDTLVDEKDVPGGASLSVKAKNPGDVATIRQEAQDR